MPGVSDEPRVVPERTVEELFASWYPALRRFAAVVAPLEVDPDDLVQEAIERTLRIGPLDRLDGPERYLRTAIARLGTNARRGLGRRRVALARLEERGTAAEANDVADLAVLQRVSPTDRAIVFLSVIEGRPTREIAQTLELNEAAVRMRKHRALRRLRRLLEEEDVDG